MINYQLQVTNYPPAIACPLAIAIAQAISGRDGDLPDMPLTAVMAGGSQWRAGNYQFPFNF